MSAAARLYLHLCGLGMQLTVLDKPEHPDGSGHALRVAGLLDLPERQQVRARRLIKAHEPALVALLRSGSPDVLAMRQEGGYDINGRSREAA